jgi:hypothetical protein
VKLVPQKNTHKYILDLAVLSKGLAGEAGGGNTLLNRESVGAEVGRVCAGNSAEVEVGVELEVEVEADGNNADTGFSFFIHFDDQAIAEAFFLGRLEVGADIGVDVRIGAGVETGVGADVVTGMGVRMVTGMGVGVVTGMGVGVVDEMGVGVVTGMGTGVVTGMGVEVVTGMGVGVVTGMGAGVVTGIGAGETGVRAGIGVSKGLSVVCHFLDQDMAEDFFFSKSADFFFSRTVNLTGGCVGGGGDVIVTDTGFSIKGFSVV